MFLTFRANYGLKWCPLNKTTTVLVHKHTQNVSKYNLNQG